MVSKDVFQDYDRIGPVYEQASFWVLFAVLVLVVGIVVRSVYHSIKPNRLVELLKRMSTGPLSETKQGPEGNIEPVLYYYGQSQIKYDPQTKNLKLKTRKASEWIRGIIKDNKVYKMNDVEDAEVTESENYEQVLDARKLLSRQLRKLEKSVILTQETEDNNLNRPSSSTSRTDQSKQDNILEEGEDAEEGRGGSRVVAHSRRPSSSYSLSINIPGPLTPSYQPTLVVNNVWSTSLNMQRLYRYTTMQGVIYPPGYVP